MSDITKIAFYLAILAEQVGEKLSEPRSEFYLECLSEFPADQVVAAMKSLIQTATRFPTIQQIKQAMGLAPIDDHKAQATAAAHEIWQLIARGISIHGQPRATASPLAEETVRLLGGWRCLSDSIEDNEQRPTFTAQWRDLALTVIPRIAAGTLPQIEAPTSKPLLEGCCLPTVIDMSERRNRR